MTIRIFNPDHDLALAANQERFTPPHAGRQLRNDLSFLPALWSDDGDIVVVEDVDSAYSALQNVKKVKTPDVEFCTFDQLAHVAQQSGAFLHAIDAWGWDKALRFQFRKSGVPERLLPTKEQIEEVRRLSNRRITTDMLFSLRDGLEGHTCGESTYVTDKEGFGVILLKQRNIVAKAPWSSSGRGVRYFFDGKATENACNWTANTIRNQGGIMVEPIYNKVKDFGAEFVRNFDGTVHFLGLSLFETRSGAYTGSLLAPEEAKREIISRFINLDLFDEILLRLERELSSVLAPLGNLSICLGVDMMIVAKKEDDGFLVNPCVEVNLRRTMGLVALDISSKINCRQGFMSVSYDNKKYHLRVTNC